jgi:hypothetical protein
VEERVGEGRVEVAGVLPEVDVGDGEGGGDEGLAEVDELVGEKVDGGDEGEGEQHAEEGGEDAADAAFVKFQDGEAVVGEAGGGDVAEDDGADEVAGDDEEDVDADEAAGEAADGHVGAEDGEDGEGAEAVDVGAVVEGGLGLVHGSLSVAAGSSGEELGASRQGQVRRCLGGCIGWFRERVRGGWIWEVGDWAAIVTSEKCVYEDRFSSFFKSNVRETEIVDESCRGVNPV